MLPVEAVQVALYTHQGAYVNEMLLRLNPYYRQLATLGGVPGRLESKINDMLDRLRA